MTKPLFDSCGMNAVGWTAFEEAVSKIKEHMLESSDRSFQRCHLDIVLSCHLLEKGSLVIPVAGSLGSYLCRQYKYAGLLDYDLSELTEIIGHAASVCAFCADRDYPVESIYEDVRH